MSKRFLLVLLLVVVTLSVESCGIGQSGCCCADGRGWFSGERIRGSGNVVRVSRRVGGFDDVHLATIGTLHIELGEREELIIEGEDNIIEHIETEIVGGTLKIRNERNCSLRPTEKIDYYLTVRSLEGVALSSAGDALVPDIKAPRFAIGVSSSGSIEAGSIETGHLSVKISSSGDVSLDGLRSESLDVSLSSSGSLDIGVGVVDEQEIRISSSGSYRARRLRSERADVRLSSSGNAYIMVTKALNARLSSSGSVYYSGSPTVRQRTSSSGRLKRLDV